MRMIIKLKNQKKEIDVNVINKTRYSIQVRTQSGLLVSYDISNIESISIPKTNPQELLKGTRLENGLFTEDK